MYVFDPDQWQSAILQDVQSGAISMARINEAVRRILTLKFQLGLFDQPCVSDPNKPCVDANAANAAVTAGRDATLEAARESMTLLRNQNNTLPLSPSAKVVVTGPSADSMTNQLGGWSVSWQGVFGAGHVCCMGPPDQIPPGTTVLKGIQNDDPNAVYVPDQATRAASTPADAYVVAVGEKAYAEGLGDNPAPAAAARPEGADHRAGGHRQAGDRRRHRRTSGRPRARAENANGVLMAYQGSTEAGQAVADVIFGKVNPSGKLPISWPSDAAAPGGDFDGTAPSPLGDQPKFFDQLPGTGSGQGHAYNPLYPFGFGLSYTTFTTSDLSVTPNVSPERHRDGDLHGDQHRVPQRDGHRSGVRGPAGQQCGRAAAAAGRLHPGDARRRPVQDRGRSVPGLHAGRDAGRHRRIRTADGCAGRLRRPVEQEQHHAVRRRRVGAVHHQLIHEAGIAASIQAWRSPPIAGSGAPQRLRVAVIEHAAVIARRSVADRRFVGTIDYVPPAQIEGGTVDCGADVYSLSTCSTEAWLPTSAYAVYLSLKSTASTWMSLTAPCGVRLAVACFRRT